MENKKCLSVRQPYAWLILSGHKTIENRSWTTNYRGQLLIHASGRPDDDPDWLCSCVNHDTGIEFPRMPLGAIVGHVDLVNIVTDSEDYWYDDDQYGWILANPVLYEKPIPYSGKLGLYNVQWPVTTKTKTAVKYYTPKMIERELFLRQLTELLKPG